jgi:ketosteroid isomerase-like protein
MSQENVDLIRRLVGHAQAGEWSQANSLISEEVELDVSRFPDGAVYHGRTDYQRFFRQWFGSWDELSIEAERFIDAGERVVVFLTIAGRGKGSGVTVKRDFADLWTVRDGQVVRLVGYLDRAMALEAVGLESMPEEGLEPPTRGL